MSTWFDFNSGGRRARRPRSVRPTLEGLDPRRLLDGGGAAVAGSALIGSIEDLARQGRDEGPTGVVVKAPHFYEDYVGPKLPQLNAVAAAGELLPNGNFLFAGANVGKIDPTVTQAYVWGIDRNGNLPTGPFPGRPDIRFDALVVLRLVPGQAPAATVIDTTGKNPPVTLPASSIVAAGHTVAVVVPGSALPSTGLAPAHYKFNYWPEDGGAGPTHIASFAPEFHDAQVGILRPDNDHEGHGDGHGPGDGNGNGNGNGNVILGQLDGNNDGRDGHNDGRDGHNEKHGRG